LPYVAGANVFAWHPHPKEGFPPDGFEQALEFRKPADSSGGKFPALIISPPPEVVSAASATAAAAGSGEVRALGTSFIDGQRTALEGLSIQPGDSPLDVFAFTKLDETESPRGPGHLVANHHGRGDLKTGIRHKFAQRGIGSAVR
jgi:hypothetical protein